MEAGLDSVQALEDVAGLVGLDERVGGGDEGVAHVVQQLLHVALEQPDYLLLALELVRAAGLLFGAEHAAAAFGLAGALVVTDTFLWRKLRRLNMHRNYDKASRSSESKYKTIFEVMPSFF